MASLPFDLGPAAPTAGPAPSDLFAPPATPAPAPSRALVVSEQKPTEEIIKKLRPGSELHSRTLEKLMAMLRFSNNKLSSHFSRFRMQELKVQAYALNQDYDEIVRSIEASKGAEIPEPINVVVPYTYATLHAAATYIASVLIGRKPVFPLAGARGSTADSARYMESVLQHNLDYSRGLERLWQHIWDSLLYSYSPLYIGWSEVTGNVMRRGIDGERIFSEELKFAGNDIRTIDPYKFRPDPRVPMHECNKYGDFMFFLEEVSHTVLRDGEKANTYKWVKEALAKNRNLARRRNYETSNRSTIGSRGLELTPANVIGFAEICTGTVRLVPKDWGLGDKDTSELWTFTFLPDCQIISARPYEAIHTEHPFAVAEPTSMGHDFLSMSMSEQISVFQDLLSWLISSRMENVRASIANSYIVDPARIEMNDMRSSAIGRIIRLKQSAMGLPVKEAIMQLTVNDVTGTHFTDINVVRMLADTATGVNDNLRGIQQGAGRRSATEARMTMQAGASRLSQLAMRISGQSFAPLANQMISNIQQWIPDDLWVEYGGDESQGGNIDMDQLVGSYNYIVSDGSLPLDKGALLEQWKEIMMAVAQDPELRQEYSISEIFNYVAQLGGAKNIDSFKRQLPTTMPMGAEPPADAAALGALTPQMPPMFG